jgi:hypothetical protein
MSRSRLIFSVVVVLLGVAAVALINVWQADGSKEIHQRLANVDQALRSAGSARVTFNAEIKPQVSGPSATLQGTSMIKFGDTADWDTTYSSIVADGKAPIQAHGVRVGQDTYFSSPSMEPEDGRSWFTAETPAAWGGLFADPRLGLGDFTVWNEFLADTTEANAFDGATDELPDVDGAEHEYKIRCTPQQDAGCPPPFDSGLDDVFDQAVYQRMSAWIDDEGRVRKLEVDLSVIYAGDDGSYAPTPDHPYGEYFAKMTFTLDEFGTPVTVTAPPDDQITQSRVVGISQPG